MAPFINRLVRWRDQTGNVRFRVIHLTPLPEDWWDFSQLPSGEVIASVYIDKEYNAIHHLPLSSLPESLISERVLEGFGIDLVKLRAFREKEALAAGADPVVSSVQLDGLDKDFADHDLISVFFRVSDIQPTNDAQFLATLPHPDDPNERP